METSPCPIAIVGIGLRLPGGCRDGASYWDLLRNGRDARKPIPKERFNIDGYHHNNGTNGVGSLKVSHGYFLEEPVDRFDAAFFSMSQSEVEYLDPQQRLLLEVVHEAFENAGEVDFRGKDIGVFTGSFSLDWGQMQNKDLQEGGVFKRMGHDDFVLGNRVSYEFDLHGPSMTVKVGCSSGLLALHLACESLHRGDCSGAIVGSSNLLLTPDSFLDLENIHVLSPDGSCRTFDANANGYARAEAVDAVYIKRLDDAVRDGNPIRAIIRGTSTNSDGKTKGLFTPSPKAHAALIRRAYAKAGIEALNDTPWVECHGTGTTTGDPLEVEAVADCFGGRELYITSVKPNIGHGESSAGLNSLIKALLAIEHDMIPPNIKFDKPNPRIPFATRNLIVPVRAQPWPQDRLRRVSVNSFGLGGANAHAIIEAAATHAIRPSTNGFHGPSEISGTNGWTSQDQDINDSTRRYQDATRITPKLLVFSAHNERSLRKLSGKHSTFIQEHHEQLLDIAYTLGARRQHFNLRTFGVSTGHDMNVAPISKVAIKHGMVFLFTGQGAQWAGMGRQLLGDFPSFRDDIRRMDACLSECPSPPSWSIEDLLWTAADITSAELAQPLTTALQIAIVNLLRSWQICPAAVVGHSSGEIAAAFCAGALSMPSAILVAYFRGQRANLLQRAGAMAAIGLGRHELEGLLVGSTALACENSRSSVTVSGDADDVDATVARCTQERPELFCRKLKVNKAYHSKHMHDISESYQQLIEQYKPTCGSLTAAFYSSVSGKKYEDGAAFESKYWRSNLENPVLFLSAVERALDDSDFGAALEIGPHSALSGPFRQICKDKSTSIPYSSVLSRGEDATSTLLTAMGQLYCRGFAPDFAKLYPTGRAISTLPPYEWDHEVSYWHESRMSYESRYRKNAEHELLGARVVGGSDLEPVWRKLLDINEVDWLRDHMVTGEVVLPAAAYIAMAGEAISQVTETAAFTIRDLSIHTALLLKSKPTTELITTLHSESTAPDGNSKTWYTFSITSCVGSKWTQHCSGRISQVESPTALPAEPASPKMKDMPSTEWYKISRDMGLEFGPGFQLLQRPKYSYQRKKLVATISDAVLPQGAEKYALHPILIDQALQSAIIASLEGHYFNMHGLILPTYFGEITIAKTSVLMEGKAQCMIASELFSSEDTSFSSRGHLLSSSQHLALRFEDVQFRKLNFAKAPDELRAVENKLQVLEWLPDIDFLDVHHVLVNTNQVLPSIHHNFNDMHLLLAVELLHLMESEASSAAFAKASYEQLDHLVCASRVHAPTYSTGLQELGSLTSAARKDLFQAARKREAIEFDEGSISVSISIVRQLLCPLPCNNLLRLLAHKKPDLEVLQLTSKDGSHVTRDILDALTAHGTRQGFRSYTIASSDEATLDSLRHESQAHERVEFLMSDFGTAGLVEDLSGRTFDLVVLSALDGNEGMISEPLKHAHSLLKSGGRIVVLGATRAHGVVRHCKNIIADWTSDKAVVLEASSPPVLTRNTASHLQDAGFSKAAPLANPESPFDVCFVAQKEPFISVHPTNEVCLLTRQRLESNGYLGGMADDFKANGFKAQTATLADLPATPMDVIVCLDIEGDQPFLRNISSEDFTNVKRLIKACYEHGKRILWLTGAAQILPKDAHHAMVIGLSRVLRLELASIFVTLELNVHRRQRPAWAKVMKLFETIQQRSTLDSSSMDCEYVMVNGDICVSRFVTRSVDRMLQDTIAPNEARLELHASSKMNLNTARWAVTKRSDQRLADQVEVEIKAIAMDHTDDGSRDARSSSKTGICCAGIVRRVGTETSSSLSCGTRVVCWWSGVITSNLQIPITHCARIQEGLSFEQAATLLGPYFSMQQVLKQLCNIEKDDLVLIHDATGPHGPAAMHIARAVGANTILAVTSPEQKQHLCSNFGVAEIDIIIGFDHTAVQAVLERFQEKSGFDILVATSSMPMDLISNMLDVRGILVDLSKSGSFARQSSPILSSDQTYFDRTHIERVAVKSSLISRIMKEFGDYLRVQSPQTLPQYRTVAYSRMKEVNQHQTEHGHVAACITFPPSFSGRADMFGEKLLLKKSRSYLLIGGLGGLGRSAAIWFAERQAGHLVFLSRSASKHAAECPELFDTLEALQCTYRVVDGDVADPMVIENIKRDLPLPLAGILHAPVVVRDNTFLEMTYDEWTEAVSPKVNGALTLHEAFKDSNLDFFVLLGSIFALLGNHGQANYAAANCFLAALVQSRRQQGLAASIIDLGAMQDIGVVAINPDLLHSIARKGSILLNEQDFLDSLELAVQSSFLPLPEDLRASKSFIHRGQFLVGGRKKQLDVRSQGVLDLIGARDAHQGVNAGLGDHAQASMTAVNFTSATDLTSEVTIQAFLTRVRADPTTTLITAENSAATEAFLAEHILTAIKELLVLEEHEAAELTVSSSMADLAVDSLIAIELQGWWRQTLGVPVSVLELTSSTSASELAGLARRKLVEAAGLRVD